MPERAAPRPGFGRVVIVASAGGIPAVSAVLGGLAGDITVPISVVQHRAAPQDDHDALAEILSHRTRLAVRVAVEGGSAAQPGITVVPGHTMVTIDSRGRWAFGRLPWNNRPGDALLVSSAAASPTIAVILTGMLNDGSEGCRAVQSGGGMVIVEDPRDASAADMPNSAIATGCVDAVLPLRDIAAALSVLTQTDPAA